MRIKSYTSHFELERKSETELVLHCAALNTKINCSSETECDELHATLDRIIRETVVEVITSFMEESKIHGKEKSDE